MRAERNTARWRSPFAWLQTSYRKAPLRVILIVPFMLQIIAAVGVTGWLSFRNGQAAVQELSEQLQSEVLLRTQVYLNDQLATSQEINQSNLDLMQQGLLDPEDLFMLAEHFRRQLDAHPSMGVIYYGSEEGRFIAAQRIDEDLAIFVKRERPPAPLEVFQMTPDGDFGDRRGTIPNFIDIRERPWYVAAKQADTFTWGDIFALQVIPRLDLPSSVPVKTPDGNLIGVLGNNLSLTAINDFLVGLKVGQKGRTFIVERNGNLVATSTEDRPFVILPDGETQRITAIDSPDMTVREATAFLLEEFGDFQKILETQQLQVTLAGDRHFLSVLPYRDGPELDWLIVTVVPETDFTAQIANNNRTTLLLCLAALGIATLSGIGTTRWLTRPLLQLNQASKAIAQGNWGQTVKADRVREVQELADSFNQMAHRLQQSFAEMGELNQALLDSENRLNKFLEALPVGVAVHSPDGNLAYINQAGKDLLGIEEVPTQDSQELVRAFQIFRAGTGQLYPSNALPSAQAMHGATAWADDLEVHQPNRLVPLEVWATPIVNEQGRVIYAIAAFQDISDRKQAEQQLIYNALHDTLTDLPNRAYLMNHLELAIAQQQQDPTDQFAVLFLDLDRFKLINDSLGHLIGDELLVTIAHKLQRLVGEQGFVARLGGDEFVVFLHSVQQLSDAEQMAAQILAEMRSPLQMENRDVVLSSSIGIVLNQGQYHTPSELLRDADIAMYRAKALGKSQFVVFDADMHTQVLKQVQVEQDLRCALTRQEFVLHYQPIVNLATRTLSSFEALVRWQHPSQGLLMPQHFIPVAEETGLIVPLDAWVLQTACEQLADWHRRFPQYAHLRMGVNLSAQDLHSLDLLPHLERVLTQTGLPGHFLTLEITESMLIGNMTDTIAFLSQVQTLGVQVSIDDFGTGYSSLNYLHRLPVDALKIDRSFVSQSPEDSKNEEIVATIITLTDQLGLVAIAEGIETEQQRDWLHQLGCELGQGFLFTPAMSGTDISAQFSQPKSFLDIS